jgi:hypothetical protein
LNTGLLARGRLRDRPRMRARMPHEGDRKRERGLQADRSTHQQQ